MSDFYSVVDVDVVSNTIFLTDVDDGSRSRCFRV